VSKTYLDIHGRKRREQAPALQDRFGRNLCDYGQKHPDPPAFSAEKAAKSAPQRSSPLSKRTQRATLAVL